MKEKRIRKIKIKKTPNIIRKNRIKIDVLCSKNLQRVKVYS